MSIAVGDFLKYPMMLLSMPFFSSCSCCWDTAFDTSFFFWPDSWSVLSSYLFYYGDLKFSGSLAALNDISRSSLMLVWLLDLLLMSSLA